jgi:hypothetical protein
MLSRRNIEITDLPTRRVFHMSRLAPQEHILRIIPPTMERVHLSMIQPRLAMCNFIPDVEGLRRAALGAGFDGVDWTLKLEDLLGTEVDEKGLMRRISRLQPLEVRYHCAFKGMDLGSADPLKAEQAVRIFRRACRLVSGLGGESMTIHLGLGRESYADMVWEHSVDALGELVCYAAGMGVRVCLENLASGWSSRPELFEKLIRMSGAGVTLDIGHARMSASVQSQFYSLEDFVIPHQESVYSAHIYHEEIDGRHVAPTSIEDVRDRLELIGSTPCDWWVLELREAGALRATLEIVREFLASWDGRYEGCDARLRTDPPAEGASPALVAGGLLIRHFEEGGVQR